MYTNTGYLQSHEADLESTELPLQINACGVFRLINRPMMYTHRPGGRSDYQILYVASGKVSFQLGDHSEIVPAGHMVLYRPREAQQYSYLKEDKPEVFWVHFTGWEAEDLAAKTGFSDTPVLYAGNFPEYQELFLQMIRELQMSRPCREELLPLLLRQLLILIRRHLTDSSPAKGQVGKEIEKAVQYFNENYSLPISIEEYAAAQHMSVCWFIRSFRRYMGNSPLAYLTSIRINKARDLLETTDYTVSEIGETVGYENPLYFSRIFKKMTGISPQQYRKSKNTPGSF